MSGSASATTDAAPAAPQNVTPTASSGTNVVVTWSETVPTGGLPISNYTVYRGATATSLSKLATTAKTTYTDTTVVAGNTYYYAVEATDNAQDISPMSTAVPVTTP
jgi:fibronectin type 3 domain-containing protein